MSALEQLPEYDNGVLRFTTAGSVDDGKSTLIGRLLYDTKAILEDQLAALEHSTRRRGSSGVDLSLLTDGLTAEREQGITIDVAYRYFQTAARKFIIADTPGHEQYTRNMVTGASTADLAIVLVDASKGISTQSRRHAFVASLLGIPHLVVAINKMDLVGYSQARFDAVRAEFAAFVQVLGFQRVDYLPLSALNGDMVVERANRLDWYRGPTLLEILEGAPAAVSREASGLFFPVQLVARPGHSGRNGARGYAGRIETGTVAVGEQVEVLPSRQRSRIAAIRTLEGDLEQAWAPQSVTLFLEDQLDVSRGDVIAAPGSTLKVDKTFGATLCWFDEEPLNRTRTYLVKHGTRTVKALVSSIEHRTDVNSLSRLEAQTLSLNDIGGVLVRTAQPLAFAPYRDNRAAGSLILIDEASHRTVAAGLIE
jgi:sulfate adenylyltransferase subunit 1